MRCSFTFDGRACPACWTRAAVVTAAPAFPAVVAEPSAVADSTVEVAAAEPVDCEVAGLVHCGARADSSQDDRAEAH